MSFQREYLEQVRRDEDAVLNFQHFRELGKYDALLMQVQSVIEKAVTEQRKLTLYPPGDETATALIRNCHILNTALGQISELIENFDRKENGDKKEAKPSGHNPA